jgi:hypothetical protein
MAKFSKNNKDKIEYNALINYIKKGGQISSPNKNLCIRDVTSVISTAIILNDKIPSRIKKHIVYKAVLNLFNTNKLKEKKLLQEISSKEKSYISKHLKKYTITSSISIKYFSKKWTFRKDGILFGIDTKYPKRINKNGFKHISQYVLENVKNTRDYAKIWVTLKARSLEEAYDVALETIDFFRGIWNLYINSPRYNRISIGPKDSVNSIIPGPLHRIYGDDGIACPQYGYEEIFNRSHKSICINSKIHEILSFQKKVRNILKKHKYKNDLENLIIRYCRALDLIDLESSFLKLWSILEALTNTLNLQYDHTIRRVSFIFEDREFHKHVLHHLRKQRNYCIHKSIPLEDEELNIYQLKRYVEHLLWFHMSCKFKFQSLEEAGDFLALSSDKKTLNDKLKKIKYARKFLKYTT